MARLGTRQRASALAQIDVDVVIKGFWNEDMAPGEPQNECYQPGGERLAELRPSCSAGPRIEHVSRRPTRSYLIDDELVARHEGWIRAC